jgi:uncharacterized protein (TIGR02391 family)
MKVGDLISALEEFQSKLNEHRKLWGPSLSSPIPSFPVRDQSELEEQSRWLSRRLGALRPFIERFDSEWLMVHPATGVRWDALDAATGLTAVSQIKGPSLRSVAEKLDQIIGRLQTFEKDEEVPADRTKPLRPGLAADRIMLVYLDHLHPFIERGCAQLFRDGHYAQSVEEAAKAVFQYIRDVTGLTGDGAALAQAAFSLNKPVLAFSDFADQTKRDEQVGFMEMLSAFAKGVRNPLAHSHGRLEESQKAFEYLVMASLLCRRVDDATPKTAKP